MINEIFYSKLDDFNPILLSHLGNNGITVPKIKTIGGYRYQEFIEGKTFDQIKDRHLLFPQLAENLRKLHSLKLDGFGRIYSENPLMGSDFTWQSYINLNFEAHIYLAKEIGFINNKQTKFCLKLKNKSVDFKDKGSILHGDLNNKNIISNGNELYLIDWEDVIIGDPIYDLAFWATFNEEKYWPLLLENYYNEGNKPHDYEYRFWFYYLRISIFKILLLHKYGYKDLTRARQRILLALDHLNDTD